MISNWIEETKILSTGIQPKLLYKNTRYGFTAKEFQRRCSYLNNTLVIAKTNFEKIIGGFSPLPWYNLHSSNSNDNNNDNCFDNSENIIKIILKNILNILLNLQILLLFFLKMIRKNI